MQQMVKITVSGKSLWFTLSFFLGTRELESCSAYMGVCGFINTVIVLDGK